MTSDAPKLQLPESSTGSVVVLVLLLLVVLLDEVEVDDVVLDA